MLCRTSVCLTSPAVCETVPWYPKPPLGSWVFRSQLVTDSMVFDGILKPACVASQALSTPY